MIRGRRRTQAVSCSRSRPSINKEDLTVPAVLLEAGKVKSAVDRRSELREAADALRYLGEGHARGKVVITV